MPDFPYYLQEVMNFFRDGFREGFAHVNGALGLLIALVAAYGMGSWRRLWAAALLATVLHLVAVVLIPVLANQARFELPNNLLQVSYWKTALALFLGYVVVVGVFFFIKRNVLSSSDMRVKH